ncbi:MAG: methionyl-tRNA formyltransferase [Desulfovibrio sp.]|jgi:methionyl-tRNA formyltransferase|nr:methionyl-tRNA formyltransferase [Desulfovibrio sp.]
MPKSKKLRIVFMGTPDFAVHILRGLVACPLADIVAVYCRPDRPAGRGHRLAQPPVKRAALELGLPVFQPVRFNNPHDIRMLADFSPDILAVASYGLILPDAVLSVPALESLNVHASLLPAYRGAAPIQRALMDSWKKDCVSGVSVMRIVQRLDSGPIFAASEVPMADHIFGVYHDLLASEGARLLVGVLEDIVSGRAVSRDQNDSLATYASKITYEDRLIGWNRPASATHAHIRAMTPRPGGRAVFLFHGRPQSFVCLLLPGHVGDALSGVAPGTTRIHQDVLMVACEDRWYVVSHLRPEGGREMAVRDFVNGYFRGAPSYDASGYVGLSSG